MAGFFIRMFNNDSKRLDISASLVRSLLAKQFPQWSNLPVQPVEKSGWDNITFRLGDNMLVRLPSAKQYAVQVAKEQYWLPRLTSKLPLKIPETLAVGKPSAAYPYDWSIYKWIEGEPASPKNIADQSSFAATLAEFLTALQNIKVDKTRYLLPGPQNFYRGGLLEIYDVQTRQAITALKSKIDAVAATNLWDGALATSWKHPPILVHGDISNGNLLVENGRLVAVIDFGMLALGDPACDLAITWNFFNTAGREALQTKLSLDDETWLRGRAWALWKALIVAAEMTATNAIESAQAFQTINAVLQDEGDLTITKSNSH